MTLSWLVVWFVADRWGDREPLLLDPVNAWTGLLLLAIALDLARQHAPSPGRRGRRCGEATASPAERDAPR